MKRTLPIYLILIVLLALAAGLSLLVGSASLPISSLFEAFADPSSKAGLIIIGIRLPRILLSMIVGAALCAAGAVMQGVFQNPMADPHILGVSSGASLGAGIAIIAFGSTFSLPPMAFLFGLLAAAAVWLLSRGGGTVSLLLAGTAISALLSALVSSIMLIDRDSLERVYLWTMGSFTNASFDKVLICLPIVVLGLLLCILMAKPLNALLLGDEQAASLGVNVPLTRLSAIAVSTLITSAAVSMSGVIGFVGLMVPHGVRLVAGPKHEHLIPLSALSGALLLLVVDTLSRTIIAPMEIPVGVLTALLGAPFFLFLLRKNIRGGKKNGI